MHSVKGCAALRVTHHLLVNFVSDAGMSKASFSRPPSDGIIIRGSLLTCPMKSSLLQSKVMSIMSMDSACRATSGWHELVSFSAISGPTRAGRKCVQYSLWFQVWKGGGDTKRGSCTTKTVEIVSVAAS